ncbi:hypothetical protein JIG36_00780 [Actinoplanes sp. LDG1-06]|uniref:Uncharacterized protein n=1 Tax=Paractinoplanes ovalisporus TaxID=2810368 RepID=A0ABS2A487_9ACTN|nr:hypothetical protein [Actinoplanes ovalisporus]MBM2614089.1 hypothetical protein [Actinoplanes ovalisporus]
MVDREKWPLTREAIGPLADDLRMPARGDQIKVEWPNGPRDYDMEFL